MTTDRTPTAASPASSSSAQGTSTAAPGRAARATRATRIVTAPTRESAPTTTAAPITKPAATLGTQAAVPAAQQTNSAATLDRIRARLADELGADRVARYFDGSANITLTGSRLDVAVPTHFIADMLSRKFGDSLRRAVSAETTGRVELRFRVDSTRSPAAPAASQPESAAPATAKKKPRDAARRFRFNDFVVGEANKLAYSAARALATETDNAALSPLFIHASWGLGKTHLLQAIAAEARRPGVKVRYTTAEAFTNGFVAALRNNTLDAFRATYRALDVLCIDDVHFIAGKKQTQSELLHTIDSIGMAGARIALASDGHPRDIQNLAEALSSRFLAGMVVRIDPPDEPLRVQLVRSIAARQSMHLDQDAAVVIAERVARFPAGRSGATGGSVRDIEGMLAQVRAVAQLLPDLAHADGHIGADLVRRALGLAEAPSTRVPRRPIAVETIAAEVCQYLRVDMAELLGKGRHKRVVLARAMSTYLARTMTTRSYPEIARALGRPNHSTVITAYNRTMKQLDENHRIDIDSEFDGLTLAELAERLRAAVQRAHTG